MARALSTKFGFTGIDAAADGGPLEALELITVDADGWPHCAWLSPGEVVQLNEDQVGFALWPKSTTSANLERSGMGMFQIIEGGVVIKTRVIAHSLGKFSVDKGSLRGFVCDPLERATDSVGYATVLSGPTYELGDREKVARRWRQQLISLALQAKTKGYDTSLMTDALVRAEELGGGGIS